MIQNLAASLVTSERITTTLARAKATSRFVERLITTARPRTLHTRRLIASRLPDGVAARKLVDDLAVRFAGVPGGYTRLVKLGRRVGDSALTAIVEFTKSKPALAGQQGRNKKDKSVTSGEKQ